MPENDDNEAGLARHRAAIDALDLELLERLNARAAHAQAIGALKTRGVAYRPEREARVLTSLQAANRGPLSNDAVTAVFRQVMSACLALEQTLRIAYLGPAGTFSNDAVAKHFGQLVDAVACASIDAVFRAAESGQTDHAVVPVENSSEGAIGRTLDLMCQTPLTICGEVCLRIRQNLLSTAADATSIARVYSHAQSLAQCAQWLAVNLPGAARVAVASNAEAARLAASEPGSAAIASESAAAIYGLRVIASHIEDEPNNTTRFWVLGRQPVRPSGRDQTSLVMAATNRPGAVHGLLEPFATHGVSMSRFESRPARTGLWEYLFFVDLVGHETAPAVALALAELRTKAPMLKVLGSYPSAVY
jgi:chorismate mutase / prephenate dehydratase